MPPTKTKHPNTSNALASIHDFFDCYTLPDALQVLNSIITAACRNKVWSGKAPFHVLFFLQHLQQLFAAAAALQHPQGSLKKAILPVNKQLPGMPKEKQYCNTMAQGSPWHWFPRHLGQKQFADPYRILRRFTKQYPATKAAKLIAALAEYALSNYSIDNEYNALWVLQTKRRLQQLIEACHLILVRTQHKNSH